jgi:hypothetical protein
MRIVTGRGRLTISDNPYPFWAFYSLFILGGIVVLSLSLFESPSPTIAVVGSFIALGNIAGGVYMMKREPASIVELDSGSNQVRVLRWGIAGRAASSYPLHTLLGAEIETTDHTDGGTVYRPGLRFSTSEFVPVSLFWYQTPDSSQDIVANLERFANQRP